jgi:predicted PurR-regulated permease PerM
LVFGWQQGYSSILVSAGSIANFPPDMLNKSNISFWSGLLISLTILTAIAYWAQSLLKPIVFAIILSLLLRPACSFLEKRKIPAVAAILITFFSLFILLVGILTLFSTQLISLFQELEDFQKNLFLILSKLQDFIYRSLPLSETEIQHLITDSRDQLISLSGSLLAPTIGASGNFLASAGLTIVYAFFFLLYRRSILAFILISRPLDQQEPTLMFLSKVNKVIIRYFTGLIMVIGIMGTLNSLGLWLIGVDHALLFGFFAAGLTIIPYLGTYIGGALPVLFIILTKGEILPAVYVTAWFILVQFLESNWITPRIIGNQVSVNALFAFMALILGGLLWGIAGMILFIPMTAVLKILFDHSTSLKSLGILLGSEFSTRTHDEPEQLSERLRRFFE